jgi:hypothetical protein
VLAHWTVNGLGVIVAVIAQLPGGVS